VVQVNKGFQVFLMKLKCILACIIVGEVDPHDAVAYAIEKGLITKKAGISLMRHWRFFIRYRGCNNMFGYVVDRFLKPTIYNYVFFVQKIKDLVYLLRPILSVLFNIWFGLLRPLLSMVSRQFVSYPLWSQQQGQWKN
jgi:hypothetical protein